MVIAMIVESRRKLLAAFLLFALVPFFVIPTDGESAPSPLGAHLRQGASWDPRGPYVDRVIFKVITGPDVQVQALLDGDIDHLADNVEAEHIDVLEADPNIEVTQTERLGFGFMAINCIRYPYNIPGLRRAIAFAMDKYAAADAMWGDLGFATDNPIPASCGAWHYNHTSPDFRSPNVEAAQAELAQADFIDRDGDGFVEAPNGDSFTFRPMVFIESPPWKKAINASIEYWKQAGIRTIPIRCSAGTLLDIVYTIPRNYDAACFSYGVRFPNPLPLQKYITSEIANPESNMLNWGNSTYDDWVEIMMTASDFNEVLEAAHQAQQVIVENAPMIVMFSNWEVYAHRTDKLEGWVDAPGWGTGPMNCWNPVKVKLKEGQPERDPVTGCGGTYRTIIASAMDSQSPLTSTSVYSNYPLAQVYSRLAGLNDDNHLPTKQNGGLAYDWTVQPHPYGLNYTFTLFDNATWHDMGGSAGGRVTAYDVAFSYNYIKDHFIHTWAGWGGILFLNSCRALDDTHVEIITNGQSYWAFDYLHDWVIIPEHIWEGIVSPFRFENPRPVGCGPFTWHHRIYGEYVELHYWENYHRSVHRGRFNFNWLGPHISWYINCGVIVIAITLVCSGFYLYLVKYLANPLRRRAVSVELLEQEVSESSATMKVCPNCGAGISRDDQFCPDCGGQISE